MWDEVLLFLVPFQSQIFMCSFYTGERQRPFGPLARKLVLKQAPHICILLDAYTLSVPQL